MRTVLFFDASAGAAGDMVLAALVDAGAKLAPIRRALEGLQLAGWTMRSRKVVRAHLAGRKIDFRISGDGPSRRWNSIRRLIERGGLPDPVRDRSLTIFRRLFEAEAEVHGAPVDRIHLHEAGAVDAILDIVGSCLALEQLAPDTIVVSPMTTGFGQVRCEHGLYPVPGPATLNLTRGCPVRAGDLEVERLTPTGAAILTTVADAWGPLPEMRPLRVGYGAGSRDLGEIPNLLRAVIGSQEESAGDGREDDEADRDRVVVLECTLDDLPPQNLAHAAERLFEDGALEVFTVPAMMKKGRVGQLLTVLARPRDQRRLTERILGETSTLGVRCREEQRVVLERRHETVRTRWGAVPVKVGRRRGRKLQAWPEYDVCAELARRHDVPLAEIQRAALHAFEKRPDRKKKA